MASEVVTALGGDITLSVSFAVANELLEGYRVSQSLPIGLVVSLLAVSTKYVCGKFHGLSHAAPSCVNPILLSGCT